MRYSVCAHDNTRVRVHRWGRAWHEGNGTAIACHNTSRQPFIALSYLLSFPTLPSFSPLQLSALTHECALTVVYFVHSCGDKCALYFIQRLVLTIRRTRTQLALSERPRNVTFSCDIHRGSYCRFSEIEVNVDRL